jgi:sporulation protein YlmC with PRC-barrel domain
MEGAYMSTKRWNPTTREDYQQLIGREVYTHDGVRIGRVAQIIYPAADVAGDGVGHAIVVRPEQETSPLGTATVYIPERQVAAVTADAVELTVDKRELKDQDWARLPTDLTQQNTPLPEDVPPPPGDGWYRESHQVEH